MADKPNYSAIALNVSFTFHEDGAEDGKSDVCVMFVHEDGISDPKQYANTLGDRWRQAVGALGKTPTITEMSQIFSEAVDATAEELGAVSLLAPFVGETLVDVSILPSKSPAEPDPVPAS